MKLSSKSFRVSTQVWHKREFNPASKTDLQEYQFFITHSRWKDRCPFELEWPFLSILDMITHKIIYRHLPKLISTAKEKS